MQVSTRVRRAWQRLWMPPHQSQHSTNEEASPSQSVRLVTLFEWERIPDGVLAAVLMLLDYHDVWALLRCNRAVRATVTASSAFRQRTRLVIPPDEARSHDVLALLRCSLHQANIRVENLTSLRLLDGMGHHVGSLTLQEAWGVRPCTSRRIRSCDWSWLSPTRFPCLLHLEIAMLSEDTLDLQRVYDGAPQLQHLSLPTSFRNAHVLRAFLDLRVLALVWGYPHELDLEVLVDLPKLEELHLGDTYSMVHVRNSHLLAQLCPLRVLCVAGRWDHPPPDDAWRVHLPTLTILRLRCSQTWPIPALAGGTHTNSTRQPSVFDSKPLRKLELWQMIPQSVLDFTPALTLLEDLAIRLSYDVSDCRALRHLTNLRTLKISGGSLRDFVQHLPKLRRLQCINSVASLSMGDSDGPAEDGFVSPIRQAALGYVRLTPFVGDLLQHTETLMVYTERDLNWSVLWRLTNVKRLCITVQKDRKLLCLLVDNFQSLPILEELCLSRRVWLPKSMWHSGFVVPTRLVQATRLRVLDLRVMWSLRTISKMKHLERLYLESSSKLNVKPLLSLHNLREIGLPASCSCLPLRKARGPGGSLPTLQRILHPVADCLMMETCVGGSYPTCYLPRHRRKRHKWIGDWDYLY